MNETPAKAARRPAVVRYGKKLRPYLDTMIARSSRVPNDPVVDPALFAWTAGLRDHWRAVRDEALAVTRDEAAVPALRRISPDHARIAEDDSWRSFFLVGYGERIEANIARCPATAAALAQVPGRNTGFFSILRAGAHIPRHRGVTKGLMTCHLGLQVPAAPPAIRMQVGDRSVGWGEGETLVFDDTWPHEVWNDSDGTRIVLLVQFERPLRQPGRAVAKAFLGGVRRTPFVREARDNLAKWEDSVRGLEAQAND